MRLCGHEVATRLGTAETRFGTTLAMVMQVTAAFDGARVAHLGAEGRNRFGKRRIGLECVQGEGADVGAFSRQTNALFYHQHIFFL